MKKDKFISPTPMDKLTQGYEKFIKGREIDQEGKGKFDKAVKKAATPKKPRATK